MFEMEQVWNIRLVNNGQKYLIKYKPEKGIIRWGHFKNALCFKSKYECKKTFNELKDNNKCEIYKFI